MVRLRLRRVGAKKQPSYRLVAADAEMPRDGRFLEVMGHYNPRTEPATIQLEEDRIYDWLSKGAQPSEFVMKLFKVAGTMERFARFKSRRRCPGVARRSQSSRRKAHPQPKDQPVGRLL